MNRNKISKGIVCLLIILSSSMIAYAQTPNILLIIADDLGVDVLNGYDLGSLDPTTPHLDSLRNSGLMFTNAWSSSVCTPTRAGIMSGKYGSVNGVKTAPGNLDTTHISLLNAVKNHDSNYTTAVIGKWHISKPINAMHPIWHGADHYMGILGSTWTAYDNWPKTENGVTTNSTEYATTYFTDDAINWINSQNNPWLLWLAHIAPHTPIHVPPAHMYTQPSTNSQLKKYLAMIESLDYEVGRLLDAMTIEEKANTTIIFIGDNGTPNNLLQDYPAHHGKQTLYQGGIHVPMFVSGYGVTRIGETEDALVNVIDIYATALELVGKDLPGGIYNSLSFKHLLSSSSLPKRQFNFTELDTNLNNITVQGFTIRDTSYKLIEYYTGEQEMYNLITDPLETNDLLLGSLSMQEDNIKTELKLEANQRRTAWSCRDDIKNGDEHDIDCGGTYCSPCSTATNQQENNTRFSVFPNPANHSITIKSDEKAIQEVKVFNTLGELVFSKKINHSNTAIINISSLKSNLYFLQIKTGDQFSALKKIILN